MTALYDEILCNFGTDTIVNSVTWSSNDQIAAMSTNTMDENENETHHVHFMSNEGQLFQNYLITHTCPVSAFEWMPQGKILAIGWNDGMISCWSVHSKQRPVLVFSNATEHSGSITQLKWSPSGKRLVTGDTMGQVVVWIVDNRGQMIATRQYKKKGEITVVLYTTLPLSSTNNQKIEKTRTNNISPPFFFGTSRGLICFADDLGHCTDIQTLSSSIDSILYFKERSRLVVITRSLLLTQFQVTLEGKVARCNQVKLSIGGDISESGLKNCIWADPGLVVLPTNEKLVRFLDVAIDEAFTIPLSSIPSTLEIDIRPEKVVSVAFGPYDRCLAVGTTNGIVAIWKYTGILRDVSKTSDITSISASDWKLVFVKYMKSPIIEVKWSEGQGSLSVVTDDSMFVLTECVLRTCMSGGLSIIQETSTDICVIYDNNYITSIDKTEKKVEEKHSDNLGDDKSSWTINTEIIIKGIACSKSHFVVWNGKCVQIYKVNPISNRVEQLQVVPSSSNAVAISDSSDLVEEALFVCDGYNIKIFNFGGIQKGAFTFTTSEGLPEHVTMNGKYFSVITNIGLIKIFDMYTPTKPKLLNSGTKFCCPITTLTVGLQVDISSVENINSSNSRGQISYLSVKNTELNSDGTRLAMIMDIVGGALNIRHPHSYLYVYDRLKGSINVHNFSINPCVTPISIRWDDGDDRVLCCDTIPDKNRITENRETTNPMKQHNGSSESHHVDGLDDILDPAIPSKSFKTTNVENKDAETTNLSFIFLVTTENGILLQDTFTKTSKCENLIGVSVPYIYFRTNEETEAVSDSKKNDVNNVNKMTSVIMRDFVNMDKVDSTTKMALLDFSYYLTLGKLDEAYRAVKSIQNPALWENMAVMCIKSKRIDVAEICLSQMGHARGVAALSEAKKEKNLEVSVAMLAIQLGCYDDAIRLYREANRYDLINNLLQASGKYDKAVKVAEKHDRFHLNSTHYQYAKHLESTGDSTLAIEYYELSNTANIEVPRLLYQQGKIDQLEKYINSSKDPILWKWWACYLESNNRLEKAYKYFLKAGDYLSCVRIACHTNDFAQASELVQESNDKAASYYFARQLENKGEFEAAIDFYAEAECLSHCIRLGKGHGYDTDLMTHALKSTPTLMLECAEYFKSKNDITKAVQLFHKAGDLGQALELCFKLDNEDVKSVFTSSDNPSKSTNIFDMINKITNDLGDNSSPETLTKCTTFLVQNKQYEKAIELFMNAKKYKAAIDLCHKNKFVITDSMLEKLVPSENMDGNERKEILALLAKTLKDQGSYSLASKMYTQLGDRLKAIKCLVLSGETKAVIQFASISRNNDIYILAANYLQQMNWRESVDIMKAIITFYSKAKAYEQLATFFESCAQVEIDEYRDYDKAVGAYQEALKHLQQSNTKAGEDMKDSILKKIDTIQRFIQARNMEQEDPKKMVYLIEMLLKESNIDDAVRMGDCLALLVEHFYDGGNLERAGHYINEMKLRKIALNPFIDAEILDDISKHFSTDTNDESKASDLSQRSVQKSSTQKITVPTDDDDDDDENIDEDISEEIEVNNSDDEPETWKRLNKSKK